ncbi:ThuA domain-containing protein [Rhodocytophaga rosea]|uniref:ThuA domain-containing protein n=1 Tax=Rhodocytophaga rosea TaxID=2704465 RepID=A0A6C0GTS5_9BACT|nr:ThuA domain-containing protein [Rhodocytophaga rosea]QHT71569.1 ThuA domain-containing protein [Rhodocytophaga rosea]
MPLKLRLYIPILLFVCVSLSCTRNKTATTQAKVRPEKRVLIFSKTAAGAYRHASIEPGKVAVQKLCEANGMVADTTEDAGYFTDEKLKQYSALVFLSSNQDVFNAEQEAALQRYIWAGGGFMGIHSATGTERNWPWFNRLIGATFVWHPPIQTGTIDVIDASHPATKHLPKRWNRYDEWYFYRDINPDIKVLATLDTTTFKSERHTANYPFAWYHEFEGGRSFYTAGGHSDKDYADETFMKHILGGITYAIGNNYELDYAKAAAVKGQ